MICCCLFSFYFLLFGFGGSTIKRKHAQYGRFEKNTFNIDTSTAQIIIIKTDKITNHEVISIFDMMDICLFAQPWWPVKLFSCFYDKMFSIFRIKNACVFIRQMDAMDGCVLIKLMKFKLCIWHNWLYGRNVETT